MYFSQYSYPHINTGENHCQYVLCRNTGTGLRNFTMTENVKFIKPVPALDSTNSNISIILCLLIILLATLSTYFNTPQDIPTYLPIPHKQLVSQSQYHLPFSDIPYFEFYPRFEHDHLR